MKKLALLGGDKTVKLDYQEVGNLPIVNEKAIYNVIELMKQGNVSRAPLAVGEFEKKFADFIGAKYALCSCNGTSSLHEALFAVGVKPGDEVIVPSYTYWASAAPIVAAHGVPVFCDVDMDTFCLDPEDVERKITSSTRAIMVVHVWGNPADMEEIMQIAKRYNIAVIEDCSHAHGSVLNDKKIGIHGDIGCFSFQGSKTMIAGEGGVLVTNNREYYERAMALGHYERLAELPDDSPYKKYNLTGLGFKHRIHPLGVAIVDSYLDNIDERNEIRNSNGKYLEDNLKDIPCIIPQKVMIGAERQYSYHFIRFDETKLGNISIVTFLEALNSEGVICGLCGYGDLHKAPLFVEGSPYGNGCPSECSHVKNEYDRENVVLPVTEYLKTHTFMAAPRFERECRNLIDQYIEAYHKVVDNVDELIRYEEENRKEYQDTMVSGRSINLI